MAGGVLGWLRTIASPWLGSWRLGRAGPELKAERVKVRPSEVVGRAWFLPWVDSLTGETAAQRLAYRQMFKEPAIKAALLDKVLSVASLDVATNPGGESPRDKLAAEFGLHLINCITGGDYGLVGLPALVEAVILPGLIDGYSIAEKTWAPETRGRWTGKAILRYLKSKDSDRQFLLRVDEFNNIVALVGLGANAGKEFDTANFVIWRHLSIFDNPGGMSDMRAAYRAFWLIDTAWKLRTIFLEKFAAGPLLKGTFTDEGVQKTQLEAAMQAAKANTWLSIPQGAVVEAMELSQRNTADFQSAINDLKHEIFLGISGAILQALEGTTTEGRGSSAIHKSTADIRKWHIRACVESVLNSQILPDAIDLNFAGVEYPQANLGGIDDSELAASLAVDVGLSRDLRLPLSKKDLMKRYGRPEPLSAEDALAPAPLTGAGGDPVPKTPNALNFADSPEGEKLARDTARDWNAREARGETIPDAELDVVSTQLEGTGWLVFWNDAASAGRGEWDVERVERYFERNLPKEGPHAMSEPAKFSDQRSVATPVPVPAPSEIHVHAHLPEKMEASVGKDQTEAIVRLAQAVENQEPPPPFPVAQLAELLASANRQHVEMFSEAVRTNDPAAISKALDRLARAVETHEPPVVNVPSPTVHMAANPPPTIMAPPAQVTVLRDDADDEFELIRGDDGLLARIVRHKKTS